MSVVGATTGVLFGLLVTVIGAMICYVNWRGPVKPTIMDWGFGLAVTAIGIAVMVDGLAAVRL